MNPTELIMGAISGGFLQWLISTKVMPKKEKRDADALFIDTLLVRVNTLETRLDNQAEIIKDLIIENERLKAEIKHLKEK